MYEGYFVRIHHDVGKTGGFFIFIVNDLGNPTDGGDFWVLDETGLEDFFRTSEWEVSWI
jgi:hypothetical protein